MRNLPDTMRTRLAAGVSTFCRCWEIARRDGTTLGLTDHDTALEFGGTRYHADAGIRLSAVEARVGMTAHGLEAEGVIGSPHLTAKDLGKGLYDRARVTIWLVDWQAPENRVQLMTGRFSEVRLQGQRFQASLHAAGQDFDKPAGRLYQSSCDSELGDARCRVALDDPAFRLETSLERAEGETLYIPPSDHAENWFKDGRVMLADGRRIAIRGDHREETGRHIDLWRTHPAELEVGAPLVIIAGCDKRFSTCRDKFSNSVNFGGFPNLPTEAALLGIRSA